MRQFSRKLKYTCTAMAALLLSGGGVMMGSYKTVTLNVDGQTREIHTLRHATVSDILKWNGVSVSAYDQVQPSATVFIKPSMSVVVDHARKVMIQDGAAPVMTVYTRDKTIGVLLDHLNLKIGNSDEVSVRLDSPPFDNQTIKVTRRSQKVEVSEEKIPFQTERQPNDSMTKGEEKVLSPGVEGLARITTVTSFEDGEQINASSQREIVKKPENKLVQYGTQEPQVVLASRSENPFTAAQAMTMDATAYSAPGGRTASGLPARHGVVAVDPRIIPLGTHLYIEGYGYAVAADTGGAINGNRIDLCFDSNSEAIAFGRRSVSVKIVN